jgi:hypothetical protein
VQKIDKKIQHYRQIADKIVDQVTIDRNKKLISDLRTVKLALHPEREQ